MTPTIPVQTLKRLPLYYKYLASLPKDTSSISSAKIAVDLELNPVLVRKDLAQAGAVGRPKTGHDSKKLMLLLESFLGYCDASQAAVVGAGKLGRALMDYKGFLEHGVEIALAFDIDKSVCDGQKIFHLNKMENLCKRMGIRIGIITVPEVQAQAVCDKMVKSGIRAIWNFAPIRLKAAEDVFIQNENLSSSLVLLSNHINNL